jgi:hypothetical protein
MLLRPRIVRCQVAPGIARARAEQRGQEQPTRAAHDDIGHFSAEPSFEPISLDAPILDVDTTNGYSPDLDAVVGFVFTREAGGP